MGKIKKGDIEKPEFYQWDKTNEIRKKIDKDRNIDWYIKRYRRNVNISFGLMIYSFICSIGINYFIKAESEDREIVVTSTSGELYLYELTKEQEEALRKAKKIIIEKRNEKNAK